MKDLKISLTAAVLSLLVCVATLIGTSFAWFSASEKSSGNSVSSGTVEVALGSGENALFASVDAEPGQLIVAKFNVTNSGAAAFECAFGVGFAEDADEFSVKFSDKLVLYVVELDSENADIPDFGEQYVMIGSLADLESGDSYTLSGDITAGGIKYYAAVIEFRNTSDNEFQGCSVIFNLTVTATQVTEK